MELEKLYEKKIPIKSESDEKKSITFRKVKNSREDMAKPIEEFISPYDTNQSECQAFVRYQKIDKKDPNSPFVLINYNFLHTHPLDMTYSLKFKWRKN